MLALWKWKIICKAKFWKGPGIYKKNKQLFWRGAGNETLMAGSEVLELSNTFYAQR